MIDRRIPLGAILFGVRTELRRVEAYREGSDGAHIEANRARLFRLRG
jgi:hypothetical protein